MRCTYVISKVKQTVLLFKGLANDTYPNNHVHTEENSYCLADCRVLNEGKLVGCPTIVPGLVKYRLGGTTCVLFPNFSFSTRTVVSSLKNQTLTYTV